MQKSWFGVRMSDLSETVVVFDLDDTLYPEDAYVRSGIVAACRQAARLYGTDHAAELLALRDSGQRDWLTALCALLPDGPSVRDCLLWTYRLHEPRIALSDEARLAVEVVIARAKAVAILTDGRSITQRLKLRALGLGDLPAYISDEYGGADKPDPTRFQAVVRDHPAARYVYVADNPAKDFVTPKALGWRTIGVRAGAAAIHPCEGATPATHAPDDWIASIENVLDI
jgi:putative hydrolase of the HAD superfamily